MSMGQSLPKLLVVDGPSVPGDSVAQALASLFNARVIDSDQDVGDGSHQAVIIGVDDTRTPTLAPAASADASGMDGDVLRTALNALGEGVCLSSADGAILWSNDRFSSYDEPTRARVSAVCRRASVRFLEEEDSENGETAHGVRYEIAPSDGERTFEVLVAAVGDGSGRVAALVWDVTELRRVHQKMEAIDRAGAELVRLDAEEIRRMHAVDRLKLLEEKIVRTAHELLSFDHFIIRLRPEGADRLELVMASGLPADAIEADLYVEREGSGICGYVASTGRTYLCADVTKDRRYLKGLSGAVSSLTVPLRLHDKVIGVFNVESQTPAAFTEEDRQFAEMFANHIALALHILDLLVVERRDAGQEVTGQVEGELSEPLEDIVRSVESLREHAGEGTALRANIERILSDVDAIRSRVREAAEGPQHILGADKALADAGIDPLLSGKVVLVADDEPKIRRTIREVLAACGCRIVACEDGASAIRELGLDEETGEPFVSPSGENGGASHAPTRRFDLVISDIKMPDRNGYQVFAAAKRIDPDLPVILMTGFGYDPHHSIVRASQEGMQCVLFKPFQAERLLEEVRKALGVEAEEAGQSG